MGSAPSLEPWDAGLKDPVLPQLWRRLKVRLRSDLWPGNSMCHREAKKEEKKRKEKKKKDQPKCIKVKSHMKLL